MSVSIELRASKPDLSQAAFERELKAALHQYVPRQQIRSRLADINQGIFELEARITSLQHAIRIKTARMEELNGYLIYLARAAEKPNPPTETRAS